MHMTNEQFSREYHLLDRLSQGPVVTHHAQSAAGAMVMVHFLRGTADENAGIARRLDALTREYRARILAVVDVDGLTAVVTKFILDFTSLEDWLAAGAAQAVASRDEMAAMPAAPVADPLPVTPPTAPSVEAPLRAPNPAPQAAGPGEFTRLFQAGTSQAAPQAPVTPQPLAATGPPAPQRSSGAPGEFTLLFRGTPPAGSVPQSDAPRDPGPPPATPSPPAPPPAALSQPIQPVQPHPVQATPQPLAYRPPAQQAGEFTRMFGAPTPPVEPPMSNDPGAGHRQEAPPAPRAIQPAGLFADQAAAPPAPPATPMSPSTPTAPTFDSAWSGFSPPPAQPAPPPATPGEYTRLFGSPTAPPQPAPALPGPSPLPPSSPPPSLDWGSSGASTPNVTGDSYLDRLAGGPASPPNVPPPPHNVSPGPPVFSGPGEFTRIISAPPPSPALTPPTARPVVPPPPVTPVGSPRKRGDRALLFSLLGVVLLAVVLVVVFVLAT